MFLQGLHFLTNMLNLLRYFVNKIFFSNEHSVPKSQELRELLNKFYLCTGDSLRSRIKEIFKEVLNETKCEESVTLSETPCVIYSYYEVIKTFMECHVKVINTEGVKLSDEDLLHFYKDSWENFESATSQLHETCTELYQHFRETPHKYSFRRIYRLAFVVWDQNAEKFTEHVTETVFKMIDNERRAEKVNRPLIEITIKLLQTTSRIKNNRHRATLRDERLHFKPPVLSTIEDKYIDWACSFYKVESLRLLKQNSILHYLENVINIILIEYYNCARSYSMPLYVVHHITVSLSIIFILDHESVLTAYFDKLVNEGEFSSLRQFYFHLKMIQANPNVLKIFSKSLCNNIKFHGKEIIEQCFTKDNIEPEIYTESIFKIMSKYSYIVRVIFDCDKSFFDAYEKALRYIVNYDIRRRNKSAIGTAKLLANYSFNVLKKQGHGAFNPIGDLRYLFEYLEDKHIFEETFCHLLVRCLIWETPRDLVSFKTNLTMFMDLCSHKTRNFVPDQIIRDMIKDIETSSDLTNDFRDERVKQVDETDFEVNFKLLKKGIWPFAEKKLSMTIPKSLSYQIESFHQFYKTKNTHRELTWLHDMFEAEVHSYCFEKEHTFNLDILQTAVLLKFNETNRWSLEQLQKDTNIEEHSLNQTIKTLVKANLLIFKSQENRKHIDSDPVIELNRDYNGSKKQITLNNLNKAQETAVKKNDFIISEESKFYSIQAAIIRIMKKKLTASHEELIYDVLEHMKSKFHFSLDLIEKSIDKLIKLEYIEKTEEDSKQYNYIP